MFVWFKHRGISCLCGCRFMLMLSEGSRDKGQGNSQKGVIYTRYLKGGKPVKMIGQFL